MFGEKFTVTDIKAIVLYENDAIALHNRFSPNLPYCELIYMLSGENEVFFDGKTAVEKEGSLRFLPKGNRRFGAEYVVDVRKTPKCIDVYFDTDSPIPDEMRVWDFHQNPLPKNLFVKMQRLWQAKHDGYYHQCMALLYDLFAEIDRQCIPRLDEKQYRLLKPAVCRIEQTYLSGEPNCRELAALCGISYSYFKRLFIRRFGMPPIRYITKKRIAYACDLLISDKYSVSDTALAAGYRDVYYFSRVFKRITGLSPTEYKKALGRPRS